MTDFGTLLDAHTIRFERDLPGPIERVWSYLTEPELKATWIGRGEFPKEPGAEFRWTWQGEDGEIAGEMRGRMRAYDPPHVLEYDWSEPNAPDGEIRESTVRFDLSARGDRVRLVLTHRALPTESYAEVAAGWHAGLDTLVAQVAGTGGPDAYARYAELAPHYAALGSTEATRREPPGTTPS